MQQVELPDVIVLLVAGTVVTKKMISAATPSGRY